MAGQIYYSHTTVSGPIRLCPALYDCHTTLAENVVWGRTPSYDCSIFVRPCTTVIRLSYDCVRPCTTVIRRSQPQSFHSRKNVVFVRPCTTLIRQCPALYDCHTTVSGPVRLSYDVFTRVVDVSGPVRLSYDCVRPSTTFLRRFYDFFKWALFLSAVSAASTLAGEGHSDLMR